MGRLTDKDCWKYEDFVFNYRNRETMQSGTDFAMNAVHAQGYVQGRLARQVHRRQKELFLDDRQRIQAVQSMLRKKIK